MEEHPNDSVVVEFKAEYFISTLFQDTIRLFQKLVF